MALFDQERGNIIMSPEVEVVAGCGGGNGADLKLGIEPDVKAKLVGWLMKSRTTFTAPVIPLWGEEIRPWIAAIRRGGVMKPLTLNSSTFNARKVFLGGLPYEVGQQRNGRKVQQLFPVGFKTPTPFGLFQSLCFALTGDEDPEAVGDFIIGMYYFLAVYGDQEVEGGRLSELRLHRVYNKVRHEVRFKEEGLPSTCVIMASLLGKEIVLVSSSPGGPSKPQIYRPSSTGASGSGGAGGGRIYLLNKGDNKILPLLEVTPMMTLNPDEEETDDGDGAPARTLNANERQQLTKEELIMRGLEETPAAVPLGMLVDVFCSPDLSSEDSDSDMKTLILAKLRGTLSAAKDSIAEANSRTGIYFNPVNQTRDSRKTDMLDENSVLVAKAGGGEEEDAATRTRHGHPLLNLATCYSHCVTGNGNLLQSEVFLSVTAVKEDDNVVVMMAESVKEEDLPFQNSVENLITLSCLCGRGIRVYYWNTEGGGGVATQSIVFLPRALARRLADNNPPKPITLMFANGEFSPVMPLHPFEEAVCANIPDVVCECHMAQVKKEPGEPTHNVVVQETSPAAPPGGSGESINKTEDISALKRQVLENPGVILLERIDTTTMTLKFEVQMPILTTNSSRTDGGGAGAPANPECPLGIISSETSREQAAGIPKQLALSDSAGNYWRQQPAKRRRRGQGSWKNCF